MTNALGEIAGRRWAMLPSRLDALITDARAGINPDIVSGDGYSVVDGGIAVVPVMGPLLARGDWLFALFGGSTYSDVAESIAAAASDPAVRGIIMEIDSPGGEVGTLFDTVDAIAAAKRSGKPLWAVASESAMSAAYAIASAADRIYVSRTGEVGSIGVVAAHLDVSAADAMRGQKWTLIHAGDRKVDGNPHEPLNAQAAADMQADVDRLYGDLVSLVASNRGMSARDIRATEAAVYRGDRAVKAGLADRVGTMGTAISDMTQSLARATSRKPAAARPTRKVKAMEDHDDITDAPAIVETPPPDAAAALRAEYAEIASIAAQADLLGVEVDAADAMARGTKPDALRRQVLETMAERASAADVVSIAARSATKTTADQWAGVLKRKFGA